MKASKDSEIEALRKEVAELRTEIERLKAQPTREVHYHYHTPYLAPQYIPAWIPPCTFTCANQTVDGRTLTTSNQYTQYTLTN